MDGWNRIRLEDLCSIELGRTPSRDDPRMWDNSRTSGNIWLSIADLLNQEDGFVTDSREYLTYAGASAGKIVRTGTLLLSFKLTIGRTAFAGRDLFTNEAIAAISVRDPNLIDARYLRYFFDGFNWELATQGDHKIKGRTLNKAKLKELEISFPPINEQRRLVAILDEALDAMGIAKANTEKNRQSARDLSTAGYGSIVEKYDRSAWPILKVSAIAAAHKGAMRTGPFGSQLLHGEFVEEGVAVLGIDNAVTNEFRWDRRRYITAEKYRQLSRYRVLPGDVLITIMGTCGRCAVVPDDIPLAINTKHLCCITLDQTTCLPDFLHAYFLHDPRARGYLSSQAKGSIMEGLNMGIIADLPVVVPPLPIQADIIHRFDRLRQECTRLAGIQSQKLTALDELKKSLLHQAFTGKLTARAAGKHLEAVA